MILFGEKSINFAHNILKYFVTKPFERKTLKQVVKEKYAQLDLSLTREEDGWHLGDRGWISKKTLNDVLSNLNQYSEVNIEFNVYVTNYLGTYDTKDLIKKFSKYKKFTLNALYVNHGDDYKLVS